ncbi:phosphatase PAP2 family protein [Lutibacter citreus]|uniref:phosphatase PAP2 family protein n=1 Tax=Lutibacter citreus TaxID=2138210 RepID=UPI000DBEA0DD|nr:phosphatase PAP2 family protein [Lutibacter citreus]
MLIYLKNYFIILCVFTVFQSKAAALDTIHSKSFFKKSIIPLSLVGLGVFLNKSNFEKDFQVDLRNKIGNSYNTKIDDYLLHVPIAQMYIADLMGVKSKNHWFDQTKYLLISNVISSGITNKLKTITKKARPNGAEHAFPSGHTTIAFTNATVMFNEFKEASPVLAFSGYAFAAATGSFRVVNNKHWISDVLVGAGIGIIVTQIIYHFEPLKRFNPFKKNDNIVIVPQISENNYGMYFSYKF